MPSTKEDEGFASLTEVVHAGMLTMDYTYKTGPIIKNSVAWGSDLYCSWWTGVAFVRNQESYRKQINVSVVLLLLWDMERDT